MNNPLHFIKLYKLKSTQADFLFQLKQSTANTEVNFSNHANLSEKYDFIGTVSDDDFAIKSITSYSRRCFFNPLIIGKFSSENDETELSVEIKLTPSNYLFVIVFLIACIGFGLIIYSNSIDNPALFPFVFILPLIIFILINLLFLFFAKINFNDAIYNIEKLI